VNERLSAFSTNLHSAYFTVSLIYVAFTSFVKFVNDWFTLQDVNLKLAKIEKQKLEAELTTLKGQLNPHFLFNSLNNIYSLSLNQSEKVPELILKLSDLMRHIIYESREKYISLHKEIEFVNNFIELQKIRTTNDVDIKYTITGKVPESRIAPLLFEPFIDNSFKHGLPGTSSDFIHINFDFTKKGELNFSVKNNFEENKGWNKKNSGIGLENVKQRLNHLYDKRDYRFNTHSEKGIFEIVLHLKLKENGN
jgi:LytS/YehU family sensor histidine kinase